MERVRAVVGAGSELEGLQRSCANAWKLYQRTRPAASPESVARARSMAAAGVHPTLAAALPAASRAGAEAEVGWPLCESCLPCTAQARPALCDALFSCPGVASSSGCCVVVAPAQPTCTHAGRSIACMRVQEGATGIAARLGAFPLALG